MFVDIFYACHLLSSIKRKNERSKKYPFHIQHLLLRKFSISCVEVLRWERKLSISILEVIFSNWSMSFLLCHYYICIEEPIHQKKRVFCQQTWVFCQQTFIYDVLLIHSNVYLIANAAYVNLDNIMQTWHLVLVLINEKKIDWFLYLIS